MADTGIATTEIPVPPSSPTPQDNPDGISYKVNGQPTDAITFYGALGRMLLGVAVGIALLVIAYSLYKRGQMALSIVLIVLGVIQIFTPWGISFTKKSS